jgi:glycogen synthase
MPERLPLPRKVLMTADTVGGVWSYALDLSRGLCERGVEVALATMGEPPNEAQREMAGRIPGLRLFESAFRLEWMDDPWRDVERAGDWLMRLEARFAPDLVHLNGYVHAALPWSAPRLVVAHSDVLTWWAAVKGEPAPEAWDRYRREVGRGLAAAELVVAPTAAMLAALVEQHGPLARTRVIGNGRDARQFRPATKEPVVFAAGRLWDEAKNLAALERVAPDLSWPVYLAGENHHPDGGEVRTHCARLLGRLSQRALGAWLGRSSIYCLPARYEPCGLSVLEAALAGCALVLGDIPSLRELWRGRAVFVPPGDPEALRRALLELIADPDRMVEGYLSVYGELLAGLFADGAREGAYAGMAEQVAV